jgi:hypothetical protein
MGIFNFLKRKEPPAPPQPGGGDAIPCESPIVIEADNSIAGVRAEYDYIAGRCGQPGKDWKLKSQSLAEYQGKPHDVLEVVLSDGQVRTFTFDISKFFGK